MALRVLIADDSATSREVIRHAVEGLGHDSVLAKDGMEAWELFQEAGADVVVSDWMMPRMEGVELCRRVREHPHRVYTYFVLLTSLEAQSNVIEGMHAGADDYLRKPLDPDELEARLIAASRVVALHTALAEQRAEVGALNEQLHDDARRDALTGVHNRLRLREDLAAITSRVERYGHSFALAIFDIDGFKAFNDAGGHVAGDEALKAVAHELARQCRGGDELYRYGGEEFLVIFAEQTAETALVGAERMRVAIEDLAIPHPAYKGGCLTVSAGVAALGEGPKVDPEAALRRADLALYESKESGRNRVTVD